MTTYRLPDALGGGEYEEYRHVDGGTEAPAGTVAFLEAGCIFTVARRLLTKVNPPPPEPPFGSVVSCDEGYLHTRNGPSWNDHGDGYCTWAQLCATHIRPPVRLVPDPFAEPVELPWQCHGVEVQQTISDTGPGRDVHVSTKNAGYGFAHLPPSLARDMARALWAAADAVEAKR